MSLAQDYLDRLLRLEVERYLSGARRQVHPRSASVPLPAWPSHNVAMGPQLEEAEN
jgi:hypothetical protein